MSYISGFVAPVATADREKFLAFARTTDTFFREQGALRVVECWGVDVPEGTVTSFPLAVALKEGETVAFSWIEWPSKAVADAAFAAMMQDPGFSSNPMPFDGQRMIFGGFEKILDL